MRKFTFICNVRFVLQNERGEEETIVRLVGATIAMVQKLFYWDQMNEAYRLLVHVEQSLILELKLYVHKWANGMGCAWVYVVFCGYGF